MPDRVVVIEGGDGTGKTTQTGHLCRHLDELGIDYQLFDFPRYGNPSAWFVERYLNGDFGGLETISARQASVFYALDRYAAKATMQEALRAGKLLIMNRYVISNMAHQGGKIVSDRERRDYFSWLEDYEFTINGIPEPMLNIILDLDATVAQTRVDSKDKREYLVQGVRDLHEASLSHLTAAAQIYRQLAAPESSLNDGVTTSCVLVDATGTPEDVHARVWQHVSSILERK